MRTTYCVAVLGTLFGVIVGGVLTIAGQWIISWQAASSNRTMRQVDLKRTAYADFLAASHRTFIAVRMVIAATNKRDATPPALRGPISPLTRDAMTDALETYIEHESSAARVDLLGPSELAGLAREIVDICEPTKRTQAGAIDMDAYQTAIAKFSAAARSELNQLELQLSKARLPWSFRATNNAVH